MVGILGRPGEQSSEPGGISSLFFGLLLLIGEWEASL